MNLRPFATTVCIISLAAITACSSQPRRTEVAQAPVPAYTPVPVYAEQGRVRSTEVIPVASRSSGGGPCSAPSSAA
jgi:hypothetical protein